MLFPAVFLAFLNIITRPTRYDKEYKEEMTKNVLKKEKLSFDILSLLVLPAIEIARHTYNGKMKTKEAKMKGALGIGLSILTGFALNFLKNKNIEACEKEIKNEYKQDKPE